MVAIFAFVAGVAFTPHANSRPFKRVFWLSAPTVTVYNGNNRVLL